MLDQSNYILKQTETALKPKNIAAGKCFLCGCDPSTGGGEHVLPRWLQKRFNISNKYLTLLNGTRFPYRSLTIPACVDCNTRVLKSTEDFVSKLTRDDLANWTHEHSFEVGRWMAKIFLGFLFKESALSLNRSQPNLGKIMPTEYFDELQFIHLLVQSWRKSIEFNSLHGEYPFTLYAYEIELDDRYGSFDVSTNLVGQSICIRFGALGFAFVADGGLQHHAAEFGPFSLTFKKLHPIQFSEIAARIHYKASLRDATHTYLHQEDQERISFNQMAVSPYSNKKLSNGEMQVFKPWCDAELSEFFEIYGVPSFQHLVSSSGAAIYTRLVDESGSLVQSKELIRAQ